MHHNKLSMTFVVLLSVALLAGCSKSNETADNKEAATQDTATTTTDTSAESATVAPATNSNASATVNMMADSFVAITKAQFNADEKYTAQDKECLNKMDKTVATNEADKFLHAELTPEQLGTLDDFYNSELGRKVSKLSEQQYQMMAGETVANPITLTPEEQQEMIAFSQSPEGQKIQEVGNNVGQEKYEAMVKTIINNELVRCGLEPL